MNNICQNIIGSFSNSSHLVSLVENYDSMIAIYQIDRFDISLPNTIDLSDLSDRDSIAISYFDCGDPIVYYSKKPNSWNDFVDELKLVDKEQSTEIKLTIAKKQRDNSISIYYIDKFVEFINDLSFSNFLSVVNNHFSNFLVFEVQDVNYKNWSTQTIAFIAKGSTLILPGIGNISRNMRIEDARFLCCCELDKYNLLPEDLYISTINEEEPLQCIFQKICQLFIFIFLFDYSNIKDQIFEYKLNGFKTLGNTIKIATVGGIDVDPSSCYAIYKIYQWLYLGGNSNDKMIIARNIISLNLEEKTLQINATTLDAILSNYKIYEKENVKQYIQVRNKLSELLIDLQTKIGGIVDGFAGDFKKNIITLLSFFISVIVIRVVSKGDFSGGFTNEVMILSIAFLLISVGLLLYARWEFTRKIDLFEKHYDQLKDRYRDLLSKEELNSIFEDCNPQNDRSNSSFVLKQKKLYTILWIISIVLLAFALVVIFFVNNPNSCSCMCELLNKIKDVIQGIFENTKSIPA